MMRYVIAAAAALLIGSQADAQVVWTSGYSQPGITITAPYGGYAPGGYYTSAWPAGYTSVYSGGYYTPYAPGYIYRSGTWPVYYGGPAASAPGYYRSGFSGSRW